MTFAERAFGVALVGVGDRRGVPRADGGVAKCVRHAATFPRLLRRPRRRLLIGDEPSKPPPPPQRWMIPRRLRWRPRARRPSAFPPPLPAPRDAHDPRERASPQKILSRPRRRRDESLGETCASGVHVRERALRANQRREEEVKPRGGGRLLAPGWRPRSRPPPRRPPERRPRLAPGARGEDSPTPPPPPSRTPSARGARTRARVGTRRVEAPRVAPPRASWTPRPRTQTRNLQSPRDRPPGEPIRGRDPTRTRFG